MHCMPDIELLGILSLICDAVKGQQTDKKLNFKTMKPSRALSCNANQDQETGQIICTPLI